MCLSNWILEAKSEEMGEMNNHYKINGIEPLHIGVEKKIDTIFRNTILEKRPKYFLGFHWLGWVFT